MKHTKLEKIKEKSLEKSWEPSHDQQEKMAELEDLFERDRRTRDEQVKRFFNERSLEEYLDDNQKRVNGYVEPREDAEDWQVRYRNLLTRNKMMAILAKIATIRMQMKFRDKMGGGDMKKLRIFNALYDHYEDLDKGDMKQFMAMWNAWQDGTVVDWITPQKRTQKIKEVMDYDSETGEYDVVETIVRKWKVTSRLLPLQDIWFGNIRETSIEEQPHIWLRFEPTYQEFLEDYGKLKNAKYVQPTHGEGGDIEDVFYREEEMEDDRVECLWYMNKWEDRMVLYANKVELYDGPIPYGDEMGKFYPIALGWYEMLAADFIYGKAGPDKLRGDQDMIDLFYRKVADRMILTGDPPVFTEGNPDLPEDYKLKPGTPMEVDNLEGVREFAFNNTTNEMVNVLKLFEQSANQTSVESAPSGFSQGDRTATADMIAENAVKQLVGLFQFFIEHFLKDRALIKAKHILQGINNPETAKATIRDGEVVDFREDFGIFAERNVVLDDGTRGDRIYKIVADPEELPSTDQIDMMEIVNKKNGYNVQYTYLTPDYFDGLLTEVEPVVGTQQEQSPALKKVLETQFQQGFAGMFPELFTQNQLEFAKDYIEAHEKDVDRLLQGGQAPPRPAMLNRDPGQVSGVTNPVRQGEAIKQASIGRDGPSPNQVAQLAAV